MKNLKYFLPVLALFFIASGFQAEESCKADNREPQRIEVIFSRGMKAGELEQIKQDLSEKGIVLEYNYLDFDGNGGLKGIDFTVDFKDGFSGSASTSYLKKDSRFGFFRDYAEGSASPFGVGNLN